MLGCSMPSNEPLFDVKGIKSEQTNVPVDSVHGILGTEYFRFGRSVNSSFFDYSSLMQSTIKSSLERVDFCDCSFYSPPNFRVV